MAGSRIEVEWQLPTVSAYLLAKHGSPRSLTAEEADVLWDYGSLVEEYVVARWPVDTGTSRDSFSYTVSGQPPVVSILFENAMFYSAYVHEAGTPSIAEGGTPLYATLYPEALDRYRADAVRDLQAAIDQTEAEIARASQSRGRRAATLRAFQSPITLTRAVA